MEKMPFQAELSRPTTNVSATTIVAASDWKSGLPALTGAGFTLRELRLDDAASLLTMMTTDEVSCLISPPPTTVEGFERFIRWAERERQAGNYACFAVVPAGRSTAIGLFQLRSLEPGFATAEWGFALGSAYWGTGLFINGARLILGFAFDVLGTRRLEARAAVENGRGNGALRKIGAVQEGALRRSFLRHGQCHDQVLWTILAEDWRRQRLSHELAVVSD